MQADLEKKGKIMNSVEIVKEIVSQLYDNNYCSAKRRKKKYQIDFANWKEIKRSLP